MCHAKGRTGMIMRMLAGGAVKSKQAPA